MIHCLIRQMDNTVKLFYYKHKEIVWSGCSVPNRSLRYDMSRIGAVPKRLCPETAMSRNGHVPKWLGPETSGARTNYVVFMCIFVYFIGSYREYAIAIDGEAGDSLT